MTLRVGTLIEDHGLIGVIARVIRMGRMEFEHDLINWRENYEIHYLDGTITIIGVETLKRLIKEGRITVVDSHYPSTTLLPPSPSGSSE